jgi:hypothetical protein
VISRDVLNKLTMLRTVRNQLAALVLKASHNWRRRKLRTRRPSTSNDFDQEATRFSFDRNADRIMALPGSGPRWEYCEIRFVLVRESGSIFDGSGYFSARRVNEAGEPMPDVFFSYLYCSPVIHAVPQSAAPTMHHCKMRVEDQVPPPWNK